jgi:hypothetical protein
MLQEVEKGSDALEERVKTHFVPTRLCAAEVLRIDWPRSGPASAMAKAKAHQATGDASRE